MSKYYLVGIGGTGARCVEAFIHVLGAGILKKQNAELNVIYVDPDKTCGNLERTRELVDTYKKALRLGYGNSGLFTNVIGHAELWNPVPEDVKNLDAAFNAAFLKVQNKEVSMLYEALFSEKERITPLDKGFRGHPAIGASIMAMLDIRNEATWVRLFDDAKHDKDVRVFIFGSVFGGTGAAGVPNIAKLIHNNAPDVKVGMSAVLPYFRIPKPDDDEAEELQVKSADFILNTRSALEYYHLNELLGGVVNEMYLVGDREMSEVKQFSLGSEKQKNDANIVELYAALGAYTFFNKEPDMISDIPKPFTICRNTNDVIVWEDIPDTGNFAVKKMRDYFKFLYAYYSYVFFALVERRGEKKGWFGDKSKNHTWINDLTLKNGRFNDEEWESYVALSDLCLKTFSWMAQISKGAININLFDRKIVDSDTIPLNKDLPNYDLNMLVNEVRSEKNNNLEQSLGEFKKKDFDTVYQGSEYLTHALYKVCCK